jgi:hypothetical protein
MYSSETSVAAAADSLRRLIQTVPSRLLALTDAQASVKPHTGGWSRKQILGHLLDSAANNHHRFVRAQFEPGFAMPGYVQDSWVDSNRYDARDWSDLIEFWTLYNRHLLHLMETVPREHLPRLCVIGAGDPVTLEFLMVDYVGHLEHHLNQIRA